MTEVRKYTNKIEVGKTKKIRFKKDLLPEGVSLYDAEIKFWPDYKPRGRAANAS